jgi:DNA-binding GntR family transcriptional regulator
MTLEALKTRPRPPSLGEHVVDSLREMILNGEFEEGAQLRQDTLAAALHVSRIPVREALRQLEAEGLVTFFAHRGAVVAKLSLEEIRELFDVRALLERDLLQRAIPNLGTQDIVRAQEVLEAFEKAFAAGEVRVWGQMNWRFHAALYQPANRPLTMSVVRNLSTRVDRYLRLHLQIGGAIERARTDHRRLLELCRKSKTEEACRCLCRHISDAGDQLVAFVSTHRKRESASPPAEGRKLAG